MSCRLKSGRWPQVSEWCQQSVRLCVCTHEYTLYVCVHVSSKPCQQRAALPTIPWDLWRYPESICAPCDRSCSPTNRLLPIFKTWKAPLIVHFQSSGADSAADTQNSELLISTQTQRCTQGCTQGCCTQRCCTGLQTFSVWRLKPNKKSCLNIWMFWLFHSHRWIYVILQFICSKCLKWTLRWHVLL